MFCQLFFIKIISSSCHLYIALCHFNIVKALLFTIKYSLRTSSENWCRRTHSSQRANWNSRKQHSRAKHFFSVATAEDECLFKPEIGSNWPVFFLRPLPSLYVVSMVSTQDASHMAGLQGTPSDEFTPTNLYTSAIIPLGRLQLGRLRWS